MLILTVRAPAEHGFQEQELTQVHTWRDLCGSVCAYGYVSPGASWIRWPRLVAFRFDESGNVDAFPESRGTGPRILDLYGRSVRPLVLQALGWETLHGSAVLTPAGLVGFCGERESGKSTIAYGLSRLGYRQQSDDTIVLQLGRHDIQGLRLPFHVRLRPEAAAFFDYEQDTAGGGRHLAASEHHGINGVSTDPLAALFVLQRTPHGEAVATQLTPGAAFTAILAHAHCFNPEDAEGRRRLLEHYLAIAATIPVFELRFSSGVHHLGAVLACIQRTLHATQTEDAWTA
jgi:hypothetical protein